MPTTYKAVDPQVTEILRFLKSGNEHRAFAALKKNPNYCNMIIDNDNNTTLHIAAKKGYVKIVNYLCALGQDVNEKNAKGLTPLDVVYRAGIKNAFEKSKKPSKNKKIGDPKIAMEEVMQCLLKNGATITFDPKWFKENKLSQFQDNYVDPESEKQELKEAALLYDSIKELQVYGDLLLKQGKKNKDKIALDAGWDVCKYAVVLKQKAYECIKSPTEENKSAFNKILKNAEKDMASFRGYGGKVVILLRNIKKWFAGFFSNLISKLSSVVQPKGDVSVKAETTRQQKLRNVKAQASRLFGGIIYTESKREESRILVTDDKKRSTKTEDSVRRKK